MQEAAEVVTKDSTLRPHILEPLEMLGVDAFEAGQLVVKARIKTVPLKQWIVGRELRKQMARVFSERGIQMPTPHMTVRLDRTREEDIRKARERMQQRFGRPSMGERRILPGRWHDAECRR